MLTPQDEADPPSRDRAGPWEGAWLRDRAGLWKGASASSRGPRWVLGGGHGLVDGAAAEKIRTSGGGCTVEDQDEWAAGVASKANASVHVEPDAPQVSVPSSPTSSDRPARPDPDPALDAA